MRDLSAHVMVVFAVASLLVMPGCSEDDNPAAPEGPVNHSPVITSVTVVPSSVIAGAVATVTVVATDSDSDILTYSLLPNGGVITGIGAIVAWTAPATAGTYTVSATVSDGNGGQASSSGSLAVTEPVTSAVLGTVSTFGGLLGDLGGGKVNLYASVADWVSHTPTMDATVVGLGPIVVYGILDVPPGTWYVDYWLDNDLNQLWSSGDYVAWYGTGTWGFVTLSPFTVAESEVKTINMTAVLIP